MDVCVCVYSVILCLVMDSCQQRDGAAGRGGEWLEYHCLHWMGAKRALCFSHMAIINGEE